MRTQLVTDFNVSIKAMTDEIKRQGSVIVHLNDENERLKENVLVLEQQNIALSGVVVSMQDSALNDVIACQESVSSVFEMNSKIMQRLNALEERGSTKLAKSSKPKKEIVNLLKKLDFEKFTLTVDVDEYVVGDLKKRLDIDGDDIFTFDYENIFDESLLLAADFSQCSLLFLPANVSKIYEIINSLRYEGYICVRGEFGRNLRNRVVVDAYIESGCESVFFLDTSIQKSTGKDVVLYYGKNFDYIAFYKTEDFELSLTWEVKIASAFDSYNEALFKSDFSIEKPSSFLELVNELEDREDSSSDTYDSGTYNTTFLLPSF